MLSDYVMLTLTMILDLQFRTARVWQDFQPAFELIGHEQAVWAVVTINSLMFLTGPSSFHSFIHSTDI
jgi:hypothetical protein